MVGQEYHVSQPTVSCRAALTYHSEETLRAEGADS
eukprot:SAG31_NODE_10008_length_1197_cov_0.984517_3_plen_34_part_01